MDLGKPFAAGRTAEIYALDEHWVLKLFLPGFGEGCVAVETQAMDWALRQGLRVPVVRRQVHVQDRFGFEMERFDGPNGMQVILDGHADVSIEAKRLARFQHQVLLCSGLGLQSRKAMLQGRIESLVDFDKTEKDMLLRILNDLPEGDCLLHGDFHPGNLIWVGDEAVIVDWIDASRGVMEADLARSMVLFGYCSGLELAVDDPRSTFTRTYMNQFVRLSPRPFEKLDEWLIVTAAARCSEGASKGDEGLRNWLRDRLIEQG